MKRRRFLSITAAALAWPRLAQAETVWRGTALGAETEVRLYGRQEQAQTALAGLEALLARVEDSFSLYRTSELTRLNRTGRLQPSAWFADLMTLSARLNLLTGGAFDPSVQPLWTALAEGHPPRGPVGWHHITLGPEITLANGQALTFNGIAQGFATDLVRHHLAGHGFAKALVNIGELAAMGGPFRLGIEDPEAGLLAQWHLRNSALAVSSARATLVGGKPHLLHPAGLPLLWSTVAVQAQSAALADGLSTALVFLTQDRIAALKQQMPEVSRIALVDPAGNLMTL
ncbi:FAD:protein FMN transferase [Pseudotabrizicola algicola]|uniref:FAD:protein FMN transferase n=1 Tax=Pseudotabrizicola algicola TaxID=2709381 RepID=A0A6B3RRK9_9RHOB|nr:FAD:protein FMN transferase [Pseudotabrizicola algicola]NEX47933.1 FAD:protein FMN transferase [Pseudotabrizicola algicola]